MDIRWINKHKLRYIGIFIIILILYIKSYGNFYNYEFALNLIEYVHLFVRIISSIFFIYLIFIVLYVIKKIKYFDYILKNTKKMAEGDFSIELEEKNDRDLAKLAGNVNLIRSKYNNISQERINDEKLKTELISNISRDMKKPLTSIIAYIKLYRKNDVSQIKKERYLEIVSNKAKKLKVLIEDLFEISKINSGKIEICKEKIDIIDLIYQVIGEWSSYYTEKNIKFIVNSFNEDVVLNVDGEKISRLMGKLISNALKYSMKNTRVYIKIKSNNKNNIIISVKNVSLSEINFSPQEILEKNKTINSGLGLLIAKGIAELHGGKIHIEKEADLFKVYIFNIG